MLYWLKDLVFVLRGEIVLLFKIKMIIKFDPMINIIITKRWESKYDLNSFSVIGFNFLT